MALVISATPGTLPSWLLPAANRIRMSNIGSSWASTNSTLAPSAVFQVCTSSLRLVGALPSSSARDCSVWVDWAFSSAGLATDSLGRRKYTALAAIRVTAIRPGRIRRLLLRSLMSGLLMQDMGDAETFAGEIGTCGLLDIVRGHALQVGQFGVHQFPGQADGFQGADGGRLAGDRVALVDQAGNDLGADALQFFGGRRLGFEFFQQAPQAGFGLCDGLFLLLVRCGAQGEQAVTAGVGVVVGGGGGDQLFTAFEPFRNARAVAAVEQIG